MAAVLRILFYTDMEQSRAVAGRARPARAGSGGEGLAWLVYGRAWPTAWPAAARGPPGHVCRWHAAAAAGYGSGEATR